MPGEHTQTLPSRDPQTEGLAAGAFILGGGLKPHGISRRLGKPLLCLAHDEDRYLIDAWLDAFSQIGLPADSVWILTDENGADAWRGTDRSPELFIDSADYRGPGGAVRDASAHLATGGPRIVLEHSRLLASPEALPALLAAHAEGGNGITIALNPDGGFAGLFVAEADAIEVIPPIGFMDLKEQWIPAAQAAGCAVGRVTLNGWCHSVRSLASYLDAVERIGAFKTAPGHRVIGRSGRGVAPTEYGGSLVARSARVGAGVTASRSVLCAGAVVEDGAVVVRSVVGPGARVPKEGVVIDSIVRASDDETNR